MIEQTVFLKDYEPPSFNITELNLDVDLFEDYAEIKNCMKVSRVGTGDLKLLGEELELVSIKINDKLLNQDEYKLEDGNLILQNCADKFEITIVNRIFPQKNTQLSGLYRSNNLFCTQCEAEGFRRITFFPDRPDVLTIFTTKISADRAKYPILLSNGNLIDKGDLPEGRHFAKWFDPFKKPSYLFALVAGTLACVSDTFITASGRVVDLKIYVEPGNEDKCTHAMNSLKNALKWDEEKFGREYDLDCYMIVAVSDFNMGAMENKGLNIFNSKYILGISTTATDQDFANIEGVIGHEYFHNWTGNRITCRDWFQLSLKEGLTIFRDQEFSRDMNSREVNRILDVKTLRNIQFPEDAGSMAHPVRPTSYQEINNFYTATIYNKGAEVIRMQQTLLGEEGFRRGMDLYFAKNDGKAVTIDDFVAAMEEANNVDFTQLKLWYSQAGTPEVYVKTDYDKASETLKIIFEQTCRETAENKQKKPFHIPIKIAFFNIDGKSIVSPNEILELKEKTQTFEFSGLTEKPVVSLLRDFSAPIILHQDLSFNELNTLLRFETNGYAKWNAGQTLALQSIIECYKNKDANWKISDNLLHAYQHILNDSLCDYALRAELLTPPGYEEVIINLQDVDVTRIEKARDSFREQLALGLASSLEELYLQLWREEDNLVNQHAFKRRKLRNIILWLLMKSNNTPEKIINLCKQQFKEAQNMTDEASSFALLASCRNQNIRIESIERFYNKWHKNDLVLDKWFTVQALSEAEDTLQNVKSLLTHPAFNLSNPNKCRALVGAFCTNQRYFHAEDGSGYDFLTTMLLKVDKINPQIAARLATPFTRWQHLDNVRKNLIHQELDKLNSKSLSKDLQEMVGKSLSR